MLRDPSVAPCLRDIIKATALACTAREIDSCDLTTEAERCYGKSLKSLAVTIEDPEKARQDSVLLTVFFLKLYEVGVFPMYWRSCDPSPLSRVI